MYFSAFIIKHIQYNIMPLLEPLRPVQQPYHREQDQKGMTLSMHLVQEKHFRNHVQQQWCVRTKPWMLQKRWDATNSNQ
jgi:hypothetical protein